MVQWNSNMLFVHAKVACPLSQVSILQEIEALFSQEAGGSVGYDRCIAYPYPATIVLP